AESEREGHRGGPGQEVQTRPGQGAASIVRAGSGRGGRGSGRRSAFTGRVPLIGGTTIAGLLAVAGAVAVAGLSVVAGRTGLAGLFPVTGFVAPSGLLAVAGRVVPDLRGHEHRDRVRGDRHGAAAGIPARALDDLVGAV